jgi:hypothetical protein
MQHSNTPMLHHSSCPITIVSGGQTGADRGALDWALAHGVPTTRFQFETTIRYFLGNSFQEIFALTSSVKVTNSEQETVTILAQVINRAVSNETKEHCRK